LFDIMIIGHDINPERDIFHHFTLLCQWVLSNVL
jgi:hypothetical protein